MEQKLRIGVVGLGMGSIHLKGYQSNPHAEVAAICDVNEERLRACAQEFNIEQTFTDANEMFRKAGLDAVSIATPNKFHAPLTITALKAGLHVLCEKPMAMNTKEAERMNEAAKKARKNLMINFSFRFSEMSFALKQQVDAGVIGDIYYGRTVWHRRRGIPGFGGWFTNKELAGGGPLIDLGVHRLDLALWLMGYPEPVVVSGSAYNVIAKEKAAQDDKAYTVEDLACGLIKFKNGATLILEASWMLNIDEDEKMITMLCGTKGGLVQKNIGGGYDFVGEVYTEEGGHLFTKRLDRSMVPVPSPYQEFVDSILEKRQPLATGEQGIKVMKILDGIYKSAELGREVRYRQ
ncbi:MAG TPA: Gfo/Idh/MocA family oxidoreductase [Candidatus Latescibacteria bacterium]|nr:Gfo/Idh/MocA family oxidoreductase [Candidatus Latescibacterota bacterium]